MYTIHKTIVKLRERYDHDLLHKENSFFKRFNDKDEKNPVINYLKTNWLKDGEINEVLLDSFQGTFRLVYHKNYHKFLALADEFIGPDYINANQDNPNFIVLLAGIRVIGEPIVKLEKYEKYIDKIKSLLQDPNDRVRKEAQYLLQFLIKNTSNESIKELEKWAENENLL